MRIVLVIIILIGAQFNSFGQGKGFLGKKMKLEVSHAPSFVASRILSTVFSEDNFNNLYSSSKYFAGEIRLESILNRKSTFGITYKRSFFSYRQPFYDPFGGFIDVQELLTSINSFQLNYSNYSGIAPLQRYFLFGFGFDRLNMNPESSGIDLEETIQTVYYIPFLSFELGGNAFLTDILYLTAGIESTISLSGDPFSFESTFSSLDFAPFRRSRILEFKFGIGVSL